MNWPFRSRRALIGIDVGGRCLNAAQVRRFSAARGGWRIEAAVRVPRSDPAGPLDEQDVARLRQVLFRQDFEGNDVVLAVPSAKLMTAVLELPPRDSGAPVDQIARTELAHSYDADPAAIETACWDLPSAGRSKSTVHVMTAGCAHADAEAHIDLFEQVGLNVCGLDTKTWAIARAVQAGATNKNGITAVLDIEREAAVVGLIHADGVLYSRVLPECGFERLHATISEFIDDPTLVAYVLDRVGLSEPNGTKVPGLVVPQRRLAAQFNAIVKDLDECVSYAGRQYPDLSFEGLLLVGDCALLPGLTEHIGSELGVAIGLMPAGDVAACDQTAADIDGSAALLPAIGLSMFNEREAA